MARTPIWKSIAETLSGEIAQGRYKPGEKLPTEAALAERFGVNRHTVRHAIGALSERGILFSRRGAGIFVRSKPVDYALGQRVRFHENIKATGKLPKRQILRLEPVAATDEDQHVLQIAPDEMVLACEGLSYSGDTSIAYFQSFFPLARVPDMARFLAEFTSVTRALRACGVEDYVRTQTRVSAVLAHGTIALHLGLKDGDALLKTTSVNTTVEGAPIERGITYFAGDRVTLTVAGDRA